MPVAFQYLSGKWAETFPGSPELLKTPIVISRNNLPFLGEATNGLPSPEQIASLIERGLRALVVSSAAEIDVFSKVSVALSVAEALAGADDGHVEIVALISGAGAALTLPWRQLPSSRMAAIGLATDLLQKQWGPTPDTKVNPAMEVIAGNVLLTAASHHLPAFAQHGDDSTPFCAKWHGFTHYLS